MKTNLMNGLENSIPSRGKIRRHGPMANRVTPVLLLGISVWAFAACSPAGAAGDGNSVNAETIAMGQGGMVNVHCVGRTFVRSPVTGDTIIKPLVADYVIDEPNKRVLQYSEERQIMVTVGSGGACSTNMSNKSANVDCAAVQALPDGGKESLSAQTRLDRILGKLTIDVTVRRTHPIRAENTERTFSARADCARSTDPTTIRKF